MKVETLHLETRFSWWRLVVLAGFFGIYLTLSSFPYHFTLYPYPGQPGCEFTDESPVGFINATDVCSDQRGQIWLININGTLARRDKKGWTMFQLEDKFGPWTACTFANDEMYLAKSHPATLYRWNVKKERLEDSWDLETIFQSDKASQSSQFHSLVWYATKRSRVGGYFYAGNRMTGKLFVLEIDTKANDEIEMDERRDRDLIVYYKKHKDGKGKKHKDKKPKKPNKPKKPSEPPKKPGKIFHVANIAPPGIGFDLSSMNILDNSLALIYSIPMAMARVELAISDWTLVPSTREPHQFPLDINARGLWPIQNYRFAQSGFEGISFEQDKVWIAVKVNQSLVSYPRVKFDECFKTWGV